MSLAFKRSRHVLSSGGFMQHFIAAAPKPLLAINELSCSFKKKILSTSPNVPGPIDRPPRTLNHYIVVNVAFCAERCLFLRIPGYFPY